jgi:hypothetical protein
MEDIFTCIVCGESPAKCICEVSEQMSDDLPGGLDIDNLLEYLEVNMNNAKALAEVSNDPSYYYGKVESILNIKMFIYKNFK